MTGVIAIVGTGLVLGAAGSGHCAVMCGPLVLLSHPRAADGPRVAAHIASYHAGRLLGYALLGALFGGTGGWIAGYGFGRGLAMAAAAALLLQAFGQWRLRAARGWPALSAAIGGAGRLMRRHPVAGPALFGALTGLLPCGLVYAALTAAIGFGGAVNGALFMLAFGLGGVPVLAGIGISAKTLGRGVPARVLRNAAPAGLAIVALVLVLRASGVHAGHAAPAPAPSGHHRH